MSNLRAYFQQLSLLQGTSYSDKHLSGSDEELKLSAAHLRVGDSVKSNTCLVAAYSHYLPFFEYRKNNRKWTDE